VSSVFDYATFGVLLLLGATVDRFRVGWLLESVISTWFVVLVVRTRKPFFMSRPGRHLVAATVLVVAAALALPYTPVPTVLGFAPLPVWCLALLGAILALYVAAAEVAKSVFCRRRSFPATTC
ncbi:MAG: cation transporting ATPase C-terminal domain-containing protein, partial [Acidobacteria bacterium]|nr:cation transporting ATPase C-terminal domain-containing protein [Acidobacteriota bacterium]